MPAGGRVPPPASFVSIPPHRRRIGLAQAHDPRTGRRRVRIVIGDKTIDGEVGGDSIDGWDFEN